ncbi:MAG: hypothetical protein AB7V77_01925 [Candidatus Woesearchaeota archaeon]
MKNAKILVFAVMAMLLVSSVFAAVSPVSYEPEMGKKDIDGGAKPVVDEEIETELEVEDEEIETELEVEEEGNRERVKERVKEKVKLGQDEVETELEVEVDEEGKIKAKMSNGNERTVKVMPSTASENAIKALSLHNCVEAEGCVIELKEVGNGNETKLAYEVKTEKEAKLFGFIKTKMKVQAQVDAENGEVIKTKKAWWAFMASEETEEVETEEVETEEVETEEVEDEQPLVGVPPSDDPVIEEVEDSREALV